MTVASMVEPRIWTSPPSVSSAGQEAVELAAMAGLVLDDWQAFVLEHSLGENEDGKWAAFEVGLNVARQNGKDAILEAREIAGLFLLGEKLLIHSAHQFDTSLEHFRRLLFLIESTPDFDRRVLRVSRSHGEEGIELRGGQRIRFRTRTKGGGRGFSCDFLALNEAMVLPEAAVGALLPTLSSRPNPQVWYAGSAVDQLVHEHGLVFARLRARALRGNDPSLAWFEWSAGDPDGGDEKEWSPERVTDEQAADPDAWAAANPGLGIRVPEEHVERERASMDPRTFAVERLCVGDWPSIDGSAASVIDLDAWKALTDERSVIDAKLCLAFDVSPDRRTASISAAGMRGDGFSHGEIVDRRQGTSWLVDRIVELHDRHQPAAVICDHVSPAASLVSEVEQRGIVVTQMNMHEYAQACGMLFDLVDQKLFRHLGQRELDTAVKGAAKRPLGDSWAWSRKNSTVDITPLVSVTLALWGSRTIVSAPRHEGWKGV